MRWVTRARPKTDRIACPWLIRRFIDPDAEILYVPRGDVLTVARDQEAHSFDAPGAEFDHVRWKIGQRRRLLPAHEPIDVTAHDREEQCVEPAA